MSQILMTNAINDSIKYLITQYTSTCVQSLSNKYSFDYDHAMDLIDINNLENNLYNINRTSSISDNNPNPNPNPTSDTDNNTNSKRNISPFQIFSKEMRDQAKINLNFKNNDSSYKLTSSNVTKELATMWKNTSMEDRKPWISKAKSMTQ